MDSSLTISQRSPVNKSSIGSFCTSDVEVMESVDLRIICNL